MAGYLVPLIQCEKFDFCGNELGDRGMTTLSGLRREAFTLGWCAHNGGGRKLDFCDLDGCCPHCSSAEAVRARLLVAAMSGLFTTPRDDSRDGGT